MREITKVSKKKSRRSKKSRKKEKKQMKKEVKQKKKKSIDLRFLTDKLPRQGNHHNLLVHPARDSHG